MSRAAAKDSFAATRLIHTQRIPRACRPWLYSNAADAAETGCVMYIDALLSFILHLIEEEPAKPAGGRLAALPLT